MCKDLIQVLNDGENKMYDSGENGYVYIIENENKLVKIGKSKCPEERIKTIELQGGYKIINVYITELCSNYSKIESKMHNIFRNNKKMSEWFNIKFENAIEEIQKLKFQEPKYLTEEEKKMNDEKIYSLINKFNINNKSDDSYKVIKDKIQLLIQYTDKLMKDSFDKRLLIEYINKMIPNITETEFEIITTRICILSDCESWEYVSMNFVNNNMDLIDKCIDVVKADRKEIEVQMNMFDKEDK